ncbi:MAG: hypothetical protein ACYTCN_11170 [Planctomycetota bacterium]
MSDKTAKASGPETRIILRPAVPTGTVAVLTAAIVSSMVNIFYYLTIRPLQGRQGFGVSHTPGSAPLHRGLLLSDRSAVVEFTL